LIIPVMTCGFLTRLFYAKLQLYALYTLVVVERPKATSKVPDRKK
jgi:hypothetical protein